MVGASNSIGDCNTFLNTAVAESLRQFADILEEADDFKASLNKLIRETIKRHKRIIFNGNSYDDAWIKEATEERGLLNLKTTPEALGEFLAPKNIKLFTTHHVYTKTEMKSRYEITLGNYCKTIRIEANVMVSMVYKEILPALTSYIKEICEAGVAKNSLSANIPTTYEEKMAERLGKINSDIFEKVAALESAINDSPAKSDVTSLAFHIKDNVIPAMKELRASCDEAEYITAEKYWPYPTYASLLFGLQ